MNLLIPEGVLILAFHEALVTRIRCERHRSPFDENE